MSFADVKPRGVTAPRDLMGKATLGAACVAGDLLMFETTWVLADVDVATNVQVALEEGAIGQEINISPWAMIRSFVDATPGGPLRTTAAGVYQQDTGTTVGFFLSATTAFVCPLLATAAAPA